MFALPLLLLRTPHSGPLVLQYSGWGMIRGKLFSDFDLEMLSFWSKVWMWEGNGLG